MKINRNQILLIALLLAVTAVLYWPGLKGGYIFDDLHSLSKLTIINDQVTWEHVIDYVGAGDTGPLKRPISVLSFLLDGQTWPTAAGPFKRTNLIIHLLCGLVLFNLLMSLFRHHDRYREQATLIATLATACWVLHPFMASTTLYLVQRMAILPTLIALLGMWLYVCGRINV